VLDVGYSTEMVTLSCSALELEADRIGRHNIDGNSGLVGSWGTCTLAEAYSKR
jgi:hypothetical protein